MSLYWIAVAVLLLCVYIALIVKDILRNQSRFNDARYEQIKKLQNDIDNLKEEIISIKRVD